MFALSLFGSAQSDCLAKCCIELLAHLFSVKRKREVHPFTSLRFFPFSRIESQSNHRPAEPEQPLGCHGPVFVSFSRNSLTKRSLKRLSVGSFSGPTRNRPKAASLKASRSNLSLKFRR